MKKIYITFTGIVEVDQEFTVTDEIADKIQKQYFSGKEIDRENQMLLYEYVLGNNLEYKTTKAKDLTDDYDYFSLNEFSISKN
jgi:hypothetical protein